MRSPSFVKGSFVSGLTFICYKIKRLPINMNRTNNKPQQQQNFIPFSRLLLNLPPSFLQVLEERPDCATSASANVSFKIRSFYLNAAIITQGTWKPLMVVIPPLFC